MKNETIPTDMSNLSTQPYKGTRDFYPEDKQLQNGVFAAWSRQLNTFGYEEYGAPLLEPLEIYTAKSGQELANEQTYTFTDRGGRVVAIRPEMTPTISRMIAARRQEIAYPARLFSIANFMRYERPQRGREREFWQLNVDIFGVDSTRADVEVIQVADAMMKTLDATDDDYVIKVNNRKLVNFIMAQYLGLDEVQAQQMIKLFDRRDKITDSDFNEQAGEIFGDASDDRIEKLSALISAKALSDLPEEIQQASASKELQEVFDGLEKLAITAAVFDATLMRGLDYYTGTVFEVFDTNPENNRALFGGGRYDGLVALFGAEPISAVGFAIGYSTIENFLSVRGRTGGYSSPTDVYIVVIDNAYDVANQVAAQLRGEDTKVAIDISGRKLDKQLKVAEKKGVRYVLYVGQKDTLDGAFSLKCLQDGEESKLVLADISKKVGRYQEEQLNDLP